MQNDRELYELTTSDGPAATLDTPPLRVLRAHWYLAALRDMAGSLV